MNTTVERLTGRGSPFEIIEGSVDGVTCRTFRYAPATLIDIYRRARSCGERPFLTSGARQTTYSEIFRGAGRVSAAICRNLENARGVRIGVIFANVADWIAAFIAITSMGATAVAIHRASPLPDMRHAIGIANCAMVICDDALARALREAVAGDPVVVVAEDGPEHSLPWDDSVTPDSLAMIAFSSGSTGRPKGIELTHRGMTCGMMNALLGGALAAAPNAGAIRNRKPLPPTPYLAGPFSHVSGYGAVLVSMHVGGRIVTMERWDPARVVELMLREGATTLIGVTTQMVRELLRQPDLTELGHSLRSVVVQGTSLPRTLLQELKAAVPEISLGVGYGLTETNGPVCVGSEEILSQRPGTSGKALPTLDLKIRGDHGGDAPPGEIGEVLIRGAMLMRGYAGMPAATGKALADGWLHTGDLGCLDDDGYLYLTDRADYFIDCGGVKVPCSALERVVLDNNLAAEAVAFGAAEGEQTEGWVLAVSRPRDSGADDAAIVDALRRAGYDSIAARIVPLGAAVPKTPSGKIDRRELRRRVLDGESL